ncbi:MAG: NACHT domain-containing protein [Anaerolineales bacterium]
MSELLRKLYGSWIDWPELITGLILGAVLVFAIQKIGVNFSDVFEYIYSVIQSISGAISGKSGDPYKLDLLERMEMLHASKALFKVSEIAVPPHLLAPPIPADPVRTDPIPEYTLAVLPNLPDWNYLSGIYHAPSISIANALSEGANFMITGELGSGKTFALAHFAILALNKSPDAGIAAEMTPIFVHAADLEFRRRSEKDPLNVLIPAVQKTVSSNLASSIPNYLRPLFRKGKALLLLDGLDECTVEEITPITEWLGDLQMAFPNVRIIASGPARNYDGIVHAGLAPVAIAPWTEHDRSMFLAKWGQAWQQHIRPLLPKKRMYDVDPSLISGWFSNLARVRSHRPELAQRTTGYRLRTIHRPRYLDKRLHIRRHPDTSGEQSYLVHRAGYRRLFGCPGNAVPRFGATSVRTRLDTRRNFAGFLRCAGR